jgi:hypothetical protein
MLALVAAGLFLLGLIWALFTLGGAPVFTAITFLLAGLVCLALHVAGVGSRARVGR